MAAEGYAIPFDKGPMLDSPDADLWFRVAEDVYTGYQRKIEQSRINFQRQAAVMHRLEYLARDGWCEEDFLDVPTTSWFYWSQRLGPQCWDDPQFRAEYARDNPASVRKVKTGNAVFTCNWGERKRPTAPLLGANGRPLNEGPRQVRLVDRHGMAVAA